MKFLYDFDINDSWEFPALDFDRLIATISNKFPEVDGMLTGQAVFLSGDVHFSFASRLAYWAELQRLGDLPGQNKRVKAVFAQLVGSSLKNEKDDTRGLHRVGYHYTPKNGLELISAPLNRPAGYLGWNMKSGSRKVGSRKATWTMGGAPLHATADQPTLMQPLYEPIFPSDRNLVELDVKPDYLYPRSFSFPI